MRDGHRRVKERRAPYHVVCGLALNRVRKWVPACRTPQPSWNCSVSDESAAPLTMGVGSEQQSRITYGVGRMDMIS
jgi:hypothetical protein